MMLCRALAVAAAAEQSAGSGDGTQESFQVLFERGLTQHTRMALLDDVFKAFSGTNIHQGMHYSFEDLLSIMDTRYFKFEHLSIPYLATVSFYKGPDMDSIMIKLCNDGFEYITKLGPLISRHKSDTWIALDPHQALQHFPALSSVAKTLYSSARVYYNYVEKRLDIKLYPRSVSTVGLTVTYEPGYPYMDDAAPRGNLP